MRLRYAKYFKPHPSLARLVPPSPRGKGKLLLRSTACTTILLQERCNETNQTEHNQKRSAARADLLLYIKLSVNAVKRIFYKKMSHAPAYIAKNRTRFSIFVFCLPNKELTILAVVPEVAFGLWLDLGIVIKRQAIQHILLAFRHRHLRHRLRRTAVIYCSTHLRLKNKKMESLFVSLK